jgi:hypothetical protein
MRLNLKHILPWLFCVPFVFGQQSVPTARITRVINDAERVTLRGNTHPSARPEFDQGLAPDDLPTDRMLLLLSRAPEQQVALDKLVEEQHTPGSANYRKWISPLDFERMFAPDDSDLQAITHWLQQQGFNVTKVARGKGAIEFSGSAAQVRQAFHSEIHRYLVNGREHWANAQDPQIPAALAPVVRGVVSLNNFSAKSQSRQVGVFSRNAEGVVSPAYTVSLGTSTYYALGPADFATIYNTQPLLQAGNNGAGQTIAVIGRSNVHLQDIADFRSLFGLGAGTTSVILDGPDPGIVPGDESESVLDLEWANATAPGASVVLVSAQDTETTSGIELAALYAVENNVAGVISVSYGECESHLGNAGNHFFQSLWEQAAAQGITVLVSSGDDGSAGCDDQDVEAVAASGLGVNGFASTPFNVAVGGTDFDDIGAQSSYWNSTNTTALGSAISYIPETTWNESCAATATPGKLSVCPALPATGTPPSSLQLWAGSGGASSCSTSSSSGVSNTCQSGTPKPAWQSGTGVPPDGVRDLPDVSFFAAAGSSSNSFYMVCQADALPPFGYPSCRPVNGSTYFIADGGTSAAAPSFAGIVALAEQKVGSRLGNLNYYLYSLAAGAGASCSSAASGPSCIFHDVVKGNNSVPCQAGTPNCSQATGTATGVMVNSSQLPAYSASAGYDLATGLGSVNAANFIAAILNASNSFTPTSTTLALNGSTAALTAQHGSAISVGVNVTPAASTGDVSLLGSSGGIDFKPLGAGIANWSSKLFPGGSYTVKAHYAGDGVHGASDSNGIPVTINPEPSRTLVNLVSFGNTGATQSFAANTIPYGSPYLLRMDVTDASGTVSSAQGVSSNCSAGNASCPTGTLTLTANGSPLDGGSFKLNSKGVAEDQAIQLAGGTYTLAASYPGDPSYSASTGSSVVTVTKAPTTVSGGIAPLGPYQYGNEYQFDAQVKTTSSGAAPTGVFTLLDNGSPASSELLTIIQQGQAGSGSQFAGLTFHGEYVPPTLGTHTLTLQYTGDANYSGSSFNAFPSSFTVVKAGTYMESYGINPRTATPNFPVILTATIFSNSVLNQPGGAVTFSDNSNPISGTVTYGKVGAGSLTAQMSVVFSQLGSHHITMSYPGDANYNGVTQDLGTLTVVDKVPTTITVNPIFPLAANSSLYILANIGTGNYGGPAMSGTVTFQDGNTPITGAVSYNPTPQYGSMSASVSYSFPTPGLHTLTMQYSGDANYAPSSGTLSVRVLGPLGLVFPGDSNNDLTTFLGSASQRTASVPLFVYNTTSSAMAVSLTCTSSSSAATCTPNPASLSVPAYGTQQISMNVSVSATTAAVRHTYPFTMSFVVAGVLARFSRRKTKKKSVLLAVLTVVMILPMASCGGGGGSSGSGGNTGGTASTGTGGSVPAPATYNFTVTATSGANTDSRTFSVTFQ